MTNWTKGPWTVLDEHPNGACYEISPRAGAILGLATVYRIDEKRDAANAKPIAAAPELYEALEGLMAMVENERPDWCQQELEDAQKALDKARGES